MAESEVSRALDATKVTCGDCKFYEVLYRTPSGRPQKGKHGQCNGVVTLVAPISYKVTLHKMAAWPDTEAKDCPCFAHP